MKFIVKMEFEKETKNTLRYSEIAEKGQPPRIGTLYIQRWAVDGQPKALTVTVEES